MPHQEQTEEEANQWMANTYIVRPVPGNLKQTMNRVELEETLRNDREITMMNRELWGQIGTGEFKNPNFNLPAMYREQTQAEVDEEDQRKESNNPKEKRQ